MDISVNNIPEKIYISVISSGSKCGYIGLNCSYKLNT